MKDNIDFIYEIKINNNLKIQKYFYKILKLVKSKLSVSNKLSLSVNFISDDKSIYLNKTYRNKDYIGDVLSFPIDDEYNIYSQLKFREIGDIFIAPDEAYRKTLKNKNDVFTEFCWLFLHGLLHILGLDHEIDEEAKEMFELTDNILNKINLKYKYI
ncbi:rRNA maturation RNase YbeY [Spiroplasma turonicum]|uniref:Endoribonuclease YbeY n=1 Tax=Spiroplasma turonicum TaxID=216946 RepID=A0A0K1P5E1_9MOLU|nr:rRNA maturation RNase YbeY [Spiroplasma turonicum]AKU79516.1 metalloprotease [Spiroplasma turonicum]ALX70539.1 16S rRNA maturation RNase YbeY [Spiroplasma turonicum]